MKTLLFLLLTINCSLLTLTAQWQPDYRLTNDPANSYTSWNNAWCIASSGNYVHVVWHDERDGNFEIYYKRSTDGGISWGADTRLTNNSGYSTSPSVSVSGQVVHVVWYDNRDGNDEIYYKRSTDEGVSWGADTRLTNDPASSYDLSVSVSGQVVHVVWTDLRDGNPEIYYKRDPTGNVVGITNINSELPKEFSLSQNYPNPFNPMTNVKFQMPNEAFVKLIVFDVLGREVATLVNEQLNAGTYEVDWSAGKFSSGVYYYKLSVSTPLDATGYIETKKMILIK